MTYLSASNSSLSMITSLVDLYGQKVNTKVIKHDLSSEWSETVSLLCEIQKLFCLYLEGDCTDVATVGMAVAVNILVARVTAWVKVGPPRAELAAYNRDVNQ